MNHPVMKLAILATCILFCLVLAFYFRLVLRTEIVYTHFFYIPIVLAGVWFGRRGAAVGVFFGAVVFALHFLAPESVPSPAQGGPAVANDAARVSAFIAVSFVTGMLSEKVAEGRNALRASEEKYRRLIDGSIAGILLYRDGRVLFANSRFGEILGINPDRLAERPLTSIVHADDALRVARQTQKLLSFAVPSVRYECRFVGKNGNHVWTDVAGSLTEYEGAPAVLVNVYDITEVKEAEEKQRKLAEIARTQEEQLVHSTRLAELGEMAAGISHELNQPLTGIRNYAKNALYMMEHGVGGEDQIRENLRLVSDQVDRASKIINKMREFTRKSELHFSELDINAIVRESIDFMMPQMKLGGVKVSLDLDPGLPAIRGDKTRLEQVFLNILTNAKQAMEESDEQRLDVRSFFDPTTELPVVVEIRDSGRGFDPEMAERLFAPFFTTKKTGHGTGLGLSISLSIIKEHGGSIEAAGHPDKGAVFTVRLPVRGKKDEGSVRRKNERSG